MFHAILVIAISLQTYGQEYFMNEEVSGIYSNIISSHFYENCNLKISKYFTCYCRVYSKDSKKVSVTANNIICFIHQTTFLP